MLYMYKFQVLLQDQNFQFHFLFIIICRFMIVFIIMITKFYNYILNYNPLNIFLSCTVGLNTKQGSSKVGKWERGE